MRDDDLKEFFDRMHKEEFVVRKVKMPNLTPSVGGSRVKIGINYLDDIVLTVTVELGMTILTVRELISLDVGSVIKLESTVGESSKILINDQPFGRGEIVIIGNNFGVRIESIDREI